MIPVAHLTGTNMDKDTFYQFLQEFLTDKSITKICHNYVFESSFSYKNGIVIQAPVYDTICAAQMTLKAPGQFRKLSDSGLKTLGLNLCKEPLPSFTAVTEGRNFDELDPADPETIRYSCADADFALRLYHICNNWLDKYLPNHRWIVENIESPTAVFVGMMKQNGIPMDIKAMKDAKSNADSEINRLKDDFNLDGRAGAVALLDLASGEGLVLALDHDARRNEVGLHVRLIKGLGAHAEGDVDIALRIGKLENVIVESPERDLHLDGLEVSQKGLVDLAEKSGAGKCLGHCLEIGECYLVGKSDELTAGKIGIVGIDLCCDCHGYSPPSRAA